MAKMTKKCRVCGKEYEACKSARTGSGAFNWREVACSPECGMEYLRQIEVSRGIAKDLKPERKTESTRSSARGKFHVEDDADEVVQPVMIFEVEANSETEAADAAEPVED